MYQIICATVPTYLLKHYSQCFSGGDFWIKPTFKLMYFEKNRLSLAGLLSWLKPHPIHQNIVGSIPGQCIYLGCGFNPQSGHVQEATDQYLWLCLIYKINAGY